MLQFEYAQRATQGAREYQEDASAVQPLGATPNAEVSGDAVDLSSGIVAVLADGMGGHTGGALASKMICETFINSYESGDENVSDRLLGALVAANDGIAQKIASDPVLSGMGSTVIGVAFTAAGVEWVSVGDSPLLLYRRKEVALLNEDHSLAPELDRLAAAGQITREQARQDPRRHMLRSAVTGDELDLIDQSRKPLVLEDGDYVILASDGLHTLETSEIARIIAAYGDDGADAVAGALIRSVEAMRESAPGQRDRGGCSRQGRGELSEPGGTKPGREGSPTSSDDDQPPVTGVSETGSMRSASMSWVLGLPRAFVRSGRAGVRDEPAKGALWVVAAMALLALLITLGRYAAKAGIDPLQVVFFRNFFCVVWLLPLLFWRGWSLLLTERLDLYGLRVGLSFVAMTSMFQAVALIPVGEVTAISFLSPLFGTVFAILMLGEQVRLRRWLALIIGFVGAMIILQPTSSTIGPGQLFALVAAFAVGIIGPLVKKLTLQDDADRVVFLTNLLLTPLSLVPALFVWQWPPAEMWPFLVAMGLVAILGHMALVRGYAAMEASLVMTVKFVRLPFAVFFGWLAFEEVITWMTWLGGIIVFAASAYVTRREAQLRRQEARGDPPVPLP